MIEGREARKGRADRRKWRCRRGHTRDRGRQADGDERGQSHSFTHTFIHSFPGRRTSCRGSGPQHPTCCCSGLGRQAGGRDTASGSPPQFCPAPSPGAQPLRTRLLLPPASPSPFRLFSLGPLITSVHLSPCLCVSVSLSLPLSVCLPSQSLSLSLSHSHTRTHTHSHR